MNERRGIGKIECAANFRSLGERDVTLPFCVATPTGFEARLDGGRRRSTDKDSGAFDGRDVGLAAVELRAAVVDSLRRVSSAISAGDAGTALAEVVATLLILEPDDESLPSARSASR